MLRVIFMGTPDFAVPTLAKIIAAGHEVICVYSQPPRRAGRGMSDRKTPIHNFADAAGLEVRTPKSLRKKIAHDAFAALNADVAVVVAYGLILPKGILQAPRHGCLNLHASALPRWRGAAPLQRAIMAGDRQTAAMIMQMDEGLDTGPICLSEPMAIGENMTAGELHDALSERGADLVVQALAALERGALTKTVQSTHGVTYASKIDKGEARIDFTRPATEVHNLIRGLSPSPGAWFELERNGKLERIKVLRSEMAMANGAPGTVLDDRLAIACGDTSIRLVQVQRAGKRPMSAQDFLRGTPLSPGLKLG